MLIRGECLRAVIRSYSYLVSSFTALSRFIQHSFGARLEQHSLGALLLRDRDLSDFIWLREDFFGGFVDLLVLRGASSSFEKFS